MLHQVEILGGPEAVMIREQCKEQRSSAFYASRGLTLHLQGHVQEACAEYERALAEDPNNREVKTLFELAVKAFRDSC